MFCTLILIKFWIGFDIYLSFDFKVKYFNIIQKICLRKSKCLTLKLES